MDTCPSGRQVEITYNDQRAIVVEVGGGIRRYEVGDRSVFDPYPIDSMCDGAHGAPLIPWPNRLAEGQYRFDEKRQLPAGAECVDRTIYDFRESRLLGALILDLAFTNLLLTQMAEPGLASGEVMADGQSSGSTRATRSSSSTPATPSHPNGDGRASVPSRRRVRPVPSPAGTG